MEQNTCIWGLPHRNAYRLIPTLGGWQRGWARLDWCAGACKPVVSQLECTKVSCKLTANQWPKQCLGLVQQGGDMCLDMTSWWPESLSGHDAKLVPGAVWGPCEPQCPEGSP